ncbi:hypothetical protein PR048_006126 [Dryococelus australis]|uniref:Uncharacterized protein n=1 Tax=Dryococelus australis TaxID=614101 RepID=A0ABQ9ICB0_9NEOP|nr:hypothetical protein PR048_006126 [Dryococelus australis]
MQQYNARPRTAFIIQQDLQNVDTTPWPARSPNLSPSEHSLIYMCSRWKHSGMYLRTSSAPCMMECLVASPPVERREEAVPHIELVLCKTVSKSASSEHQFMKLPIKYSTVAKLVSLFPHTVALRDGVEIWTTILHRALESRVGSGAGIQGRGKREILEKTRRPAASSRTILTCVNPGVTLPGIEPGSPSNTGMKGLGKREVPEKTPSTSDIVRNDSHMGKIRVEQWSVNIWAVSVSGLWVCDSEARIARAGEAGTPRENSSTNGIVRHSSDVRRSGESLHLESNPVRLGERRQVQLFFSECGCAPLPQHVAVACGEVVFAPHCVDSPKQVRLFFSECGCAPLPQHVGVACESGTAALPYSACVNPDSALVGSEVLRADEVMDVSMERRWNERAGGGGRQIPEKTRRPSSGTIPTCENGVPGRGLNTVYALVAGEQFNRSATADPVAGFTRCEMPTLHENFLHKFVCKANLARNEKIEPVLFFSCKAMQVAILLVLVCCSCDLIKYQLSCMACQNKIHACAILLQTTIIPSKVNAYLPRTGAELLLRTTMASLMITGTLRVPLGITLCEAMLNTESTDFTDAAELTKCGDKCGAKCGVECESVPRKQGAEFPGLLYGYLFRIPDPLRPSPNPSAVIDHPPSHPPPPTLTILLHNELYLLSICHVGGTRAGTRNPPTTGTIEQTIQFVESRGHHESLFTSRKNAVIAGYREQPQGVASGVFSLTSRVWGVVGGAGVRGAGVVSGMPVECDFGGRFRESAVCDSSVILRDLIMIALPESVCWSSQVLTHRRPDYVCYQPA